MKAFKKKIIIGAIALAAANPIPAVAAMPVVDAPLATLLTAMTVQFNTFSERLFFTLQGMITAINSTTNAVGDSTSKAIGSTMAGVESNRADARYSHADPCSVAPQTRTVVGLMKSSVARTMSLGRKAPPADVGGDGSKSAALKRMLDYTSEVAVVPSPEAQLVNGASAGCQAFAGGGARAQSCRAAGLSKGAGDNTTPDADIRAETLFDGPQRTTQSEPMTRRTIASERNSADQLAIAAFMRNITTPLNLRSLTDGELASEEGRRFLGLKDTYDARISLAEYPLRKWAAGLVESAETLPYLQELMNADSQRDFVISYLDKVAPKWKTKGISQDEFINLEIQRRYANVDWQEAMAAASPEANAREHLQVAAFQSYLMGRVLDELRQLNIQVGTLNAANVRTEMLPRLTAQHRAAQK